MDPGATIGPFEIIAPLGSGGMGEVYRARDTRLGRLVALKFLAVDADGAARERFQREARAIATLSHPHICALYEIGEHASRPYLVLELLEGETLRARLKRGPLATATLAEFAAQIADALDAAHRKGVLHRDLKPDNIWVGPGEQVKVLDFGLARLEEPDANGDSRGGPTPSQAETLLTSPGMTLGTIPYMSPEQARGEALDARSDIFSFGAVFYEMATGRPPFQAPSAGGLIAAIVKDDPPPAERLRPDLPPQLGQIARRCLEKDAELRYQSAAEIRAELRWLRRESAAAGAPAPPAAMGEPPAGATAGTATAAALSAAAPDAAPAALSDSQIALGLARRVLRRRWPWPVAVAVIASGYLAYHLLAGGGLAAPPQFNFRQLTFNGQVQHAAISRDGKFLAYVEATPAGPALHTLAIATGSDVEIVPPGNGCCRGPAIAPDDSRVYFWANDWIEAAPLLGGPAQKILYNAATSVGFSPRGRRFAFVYQRANAIFPNLAIANADGSGFRIVARGTAQAGFVSYHYGSGQASAPAWSPDGLRIAAPTLATTTGTGGYPVTVASLATGRERQIAPPGASGTFLSAAWAPDGRGLFAIAAINSASPPQLWYVAWPSRRLTRLTDDLSGYDGISASAAGSLVMLHAAPQYSLAVGRPGAMTTVSAANATYQSQIAWMPDGRLIFTRNLDGGDQIWIENADGGAARAIVARARFTPYFPTGTVGGQVLFVNGDDLWRVNPDGTGLTRIASSPGGFWPATGLASGTLFIYMGDAAGAQFAGQVAVVGGKPRRIWSGYVYADGTAASPHGRRLFLISKAPDGSHAPVVLDLTQTPPAVIHLPPFFAAPADYFNGQFAWTPDGKAISYVRRQGLVDNLWAMPVAGGKPYELTHFSHLQIAGYAWSSDGRLAISRGEQNTDAVLATAVPGPAGH